MTDFQTDKKNLLFLLEQIDQRELALPDFQRDFVWEASATRDLVVSIIRSFPAGALLFVQGSGKLFAPRAVEQAPELLGDPPYLVLDGQQRLTSLYLAFSGKGTHRYFLTLKPLLDEAVRDPDVDEAVKVYHHTRVRKWATAEGQAEDLVLPLSEVRNWADWRDRILSLRPETGEDRQVLQAGLNRVNHRYIKPVEQYQFPLTVLGPSASPEAVCTIFETLNRTGVKLTVFELLTARAWAAGVELRRLWHQSQEKHEILSDFEIDPYYVLQVIALLEGKSPKRSAVLNLEVATMKDRWEDAAEGLAGVLTMLREDCGVFVPKWMPYQTILLTLGAVWHRVAGSYGAGIGAGRSKLERYFWCSSFSGHYENAPNTVAEQDTRALTDWLAGGPSPEVVETFSFDPERWRQTTARQRALYQATIALMMSGGALDFHQTVKLDQHVVNGYAVDDHHVFPKGYLGVTQDPTFVDSVLNHTLIDKRTNLLISDHAPSVYLSDIAAVLGEDKLAAVLSSHHLPNSPGGPLWRDDFADFLDWRSSELHSLLRAVT